MSDVIIKRIEEDGELKERVYIPDPDIEDTIITKEQQIRELLAVSGMDSDIIDATIQKMKEDGLVNL